MTEPHLLEQVHQAALRILAETGFATDDANMQARLAGLGCKTAAGRVYVPAELVASMLEAVPSSFRLYGRADPRGVLVDAQGPSLYTNTGILPNIYDFETGCVRRSLLQDVVDTTRMLDALSEVDVVYASLMDATEAAPHLITVIDFAATLANTTKPLVGPGITNRGEAKAIIALALALRGGDPQALAARPLCAPFVGSITPLYVPKDSVEALEEIVLAGLPVMALTNPVMGATAPYTIAGSAALGHAEMLSLLVMAQAIKPGAAVISFNTPSIADMRSLASTTGGPETGLLRSLAVEVPRALGIPTFAHAHTSSARLDIQAADEKSINSLLLAQAGPSVMGGLGGLANVTLTSYETLVVDNERFGALRRVLRGVSVDAEHLGVAVVADMVQGQNVIMHDHTLKYLRSAEVWRPKLARRQGLVNGQPESGSMLERARVEARRILDQHQVEPLPEAVQQEIEAVCQRYDAQCRQTG